MNERREGIELFRSLLVMVVGQAFNAAGYTLDHTPLQWAGGKFRFTKPLSADLVAAIDYQVLVYTETGYAARMPSRFRVTLGRGAAKGAFNAHPQHITRTLSALVVEDFGVPILPTADHWWTYQDAASLGRALAEAGHLVVGYGMPWLDGSLIPPHS
jgi:hypothetical protein